MTLLQFHRAVAHMDVWSASGDGFSFVISHESPTGPGFHGRTGYLASWRGLHSNSLAIKIGESPVENFCGGRGGLQRDAGCSECAQRPTAVGTMSWLRLLSPNATP